MNLQPPRQLSHARQLLAGPQLLRNDKKRNLLHQLLPQRNVRVDSVLAVGAALLVGVGAVVAFRERGGKEDGHA